VENVVLLELRSSNQALTVGSSIHCDQLDHLEELSLEGPHVGVLAVSGASRGTKEPAPVGERDPRVVLEPGGPL
jgi:hypothetical protein